MRVVQIPVFQILACLAVAAAGLVPVAHLNRPFWGLYGVSIDHGPPRIHQVDGNSPAAAAGVRVGDIILAVNGSPVDNSGLGAVLDKLGPGEAAQLRVKRGEAEVEVTARGVEPPVAAVYYPTAWHPAAGSVGFAVGLLVLATQPVWPAPRWRPVLVGAAGLACAAVFFLAVAYDSPFALWTLRRYHNLNWGGGRWHFGQSWVGLFGSLVLAVLAACELRASFARPTASEISGPPGGRS